MDEIDSLLLNDAVRTCLEEIWREASPDSPLPLVSVRRPLLERIGVQVMPHLPAYSLLKEDVLDVVWDAARTTRTASPNWSCLAARLKRHLAQEQPGEPFPIAECAPHDDYNAYIGQPIWFAKHVMLAGVTNGTLYAQVIGRASQRAVGCFSLQTEEAIVSALRSVNLVSSFNNDHVGHSWEGLDNWLLDLPFIADQDEWPLMQAEAADSLTLLLDATCSSDEVLTRMKRAMQYVVSSDAQREHGPGMCLAIAAAESLLCNRSEQVRKQFVQRGALFLENDPRYWKQAQHALGYLYEGRSLFIHGSRFDGAEQPWDRIRARALAAALLLVCRELHANSEIFGWWSQYRTRTSLFPDTFDPLVNRMWREDKLRPRDKRR